MGEPLFWTNERQQYLFSHLGRQPITRIAKSLGTSRGAIRQYLKAEHQTSAFRHIEQYVLGNRMTASQISNGLGINRTTILSWMRRAADPLPSETVVWFDRYIRVATRTTLIAWLKQSGALLNDAATPAPEWRLVVQQILDDWHVIYIDGEHLMRVLARSDLRRLRAERGFPASRIIGSGDRRAAWYRRDVMRRWLDANPSYWTAAAREELEQ